MVNTDERMVYGWAEKEGARDCRVVSMSLEDQFIEFTAPAKKGRLFEWEYN